MDEYPPEYALHNLPFIVLSGLAVTGEHESLPPVQDVLPGRAAATISSELPPVTGERAEQLLKDFLSADGRFAPWNARGMNRRGNTLGFRIRAVGRDFKIPPKRADAPTSSGTSPPASPTIAPSWSLHSPLSPLTPSSPIFPDGIMAPSWIAKHQQYLPSVFISFFNFTSDPNMNSLNDNRLKTEINAIKDQIRKSGHYTRFAAVVLSDKYVFEAPDIEERLATIARATNLDQKNSLFFLPPHPSPAELRSFAMTVLSTIQPMCVEYYRDRTKHARRKKGRSSAPPPTAPPTRGTSHPLSQTGWNIRYDFKLGVFAEFRQEMDAAQRHYNIALDTLFGSDGIFETTASWSPRWDEIRLLADAVALRHIRCQLWNNHPTSAAQTWLRYKTKLRDLLDRRAKGSSNYGWEAWESRWAQIMAQLIQRAELPVFKITQPISEDDPLVDGANPTFSPPEKQFPIGERLPPWELLHHAGYWFKSSANHAKRRFILAREIPEEDRTPPGLSPATKVSNRNQTYDHYLVPEPHMEMPIQGTAGGFEHWKDIVNKLGEAMSEFNARGQLRKAEQLQLDISRTLLHVKKYDRAFEILRPLWENMSWRRERWWAIASEALWALHECALRVQDMEAYVVSEWELYSPVFTAKSRYKHDLMACLDSFTEEDALEGKPSININAKDYVSCLSITFTFSNGEGNVGEPLHSQIAITSTARQGSVPITLSTVIFQFKGCLSDVQLTHESEDTSTDSDSRVSECALEETPTATQKPRWSGTSDLTIHPGQTRAYNFPIIFREAGDVEGVASISEINTSRFDFIFTNVQSDPDIEERPMWWVKSGPTLKPRKLNRGIATSVKVLPKPPKMEIRFPDVREQYYTDEPVSLALEVINKEEEETEAVLEVRLLGRSKDTLGYSWVGREASSPMKEVPPPIDDSSDVDLPGHVVGRLTQGATITEKIQFNAPSEPADYVLEVKVLYHLLSDRDIPISKTMTTDLIFNGPFEASYDFTPRVHPDPWPSYFEVQDTPPEKAEAVVASGIAQKYHLRAKVASFADDILIIKDMAIDAQSVHGGATCEIAREFDEAEVPMHPQDLHERSFCVDTQKLTLDERRPTYLDLNLHVTWQRSGSPSPSNPVVTSTLTIPRITIPTGEPRVLATALRSATVPSLIHMDYVLENPTMHFLTFELNMEASEEFGFSGPKLRSLHLLPMSRQTVRFNLYPLVRDAWITPQLKVVDRYFNQTLKVVATDGLRSGKKGVGIWVAGDGDETGHGDLEKGKIEA